MSVVELLLDAQRRMNEHGPMRMSESAALAAFLQSRYMGVVPIHFKRGKIAKIDLPNGVEIVIDPNVE